MNKLKAGFCRLNINPPQRTPINGYASARHVENVLDDLSVNALALRVENTTVLLLAVDNCAIDSVTCLDLRQHISEITGIPVDAVFLHTTHIHTAPQLGQINNWAPLEFKEQSDLLKKYEQFMYASLANAAKQAIADCKDARLGWAVGQVSGISFLRQFRMKDGTVCTDPGAENPEILRPMGEADANVNVLRFDRANDTLVLVNFGCLPDNIGGNQISADFPGFLRHDLENSLNSVKCIFVNGAHADVNATGFDNTPRGYDHARHIGKTLADAVTKVFHQVHYEDVDALRFLRKTITVPSHRSRPEQVPLASEYYRAFEHGRLDEIPFTGKKLDEVLAESGRILRLRYGPDSYQLELGGIAMGSIALVALPGDSFAGIGSAIQEAQGWSRVLPMSLTDGFKGRFPTDEAYDDEYIEARASCYRSGIGSRLISESQELINTMR